MISIVRGPEILDKVGLLTHFEKSKYVVALKGTKYRAS